MLSVLIAAALAAPTVVPAELEARGPGEALVTVDAFGRYALTVTSDQGTALQLVDRMRGPRESAGSPGATDGRLDVFLDRGTYKVRTTSHALGTGQAELAVHGFTELADGRPPILDELRWEHGTLSDLEQRSWWVEIDEPRAVFFEAGGRALADLRLWRDGTWLVDAAPSLEEVQPVEGQPLRVATLSAVLDRGLYLVTAYGGPELTWAEESPDRPLHLRWGVPEIGSAGRRSATMSPLGRDRYRIRDASLIRLEVPVATDATVRVARWDPMNPTRSDGRTGQITEESVPPAVSVHDSSGSERIVTVTAAAGQTYTLQHFTPSSDETTLHGTGAYWLTTLHTGDPADSIDATGVLTQQPLLGSVSRARVIESQAVLLDQGHGYMRRFNAHRQLSLLVEVGEAGRYLAQVDGIAARVGFRHFFAGSPPPDYRPPVPRDDGAWELDAGLYVVDLVPVTDGIATLALKPARRGQVAPAPATGAVQLGVVELDGEAQRTVLHRNTQGDVESGVILRELPVDVRDPLPLSHWGSGQVEVPITVEEAGLLEAWSTEGSRLLLTVDGGTPAPEHQLQPGRYTVRVNGAGHTGSSLGLTPDRYRSSMPPRPMPDATLAQLPELPELTAGAPHHLDLERTSQAITRVRVDQPGLVQVGSTGLLATEGTLRTRTDPVLVRDAGSGPGRNFLLQTYLREGDYQLRVATQGQTRGHLGLELTPTELLDGGELHPDVPARSSLKAGQGVVYRVVVPEDGRWRLRSFGVGRTFTGRLEDADGWPLVRPGVPIDRTDRLAAGTYRLVLLPDDVASRRLTLLERVEGAVVRDGHGPHALALGERVTHTWWESEERTPDTWSFDLPAPARVTVTATAGMHGVLRRGDEEVARLYAGEALTEELPAGAYRLELLSSRRDTGREYGLSVSTRELTAGQSRAVTAPATLSVSVGEDGLVELESFGSTDVRARLVDASGAVVARSDDRPDDWNFAMSERLDPGTYTLRVEPVGVGRGPTEVRMAAPVEVEEQPLSLPVDQHLRPGRAVHLFPLELPGRAEVLTVALDAPETVTATLERRVGTRWEAVDASVGRRVQLAARVDDGGAWRLRLGSLDRRGNAVHLRVAAERAPRAGESSLQTGMRLRDGGAGLGAVVAGLRDPGTLSVQGSGLRWCPDAGARCVPVQDGTVTPHEDALWLVGPVATRVRARRVRLDGGEVVRVHLHGEARVDLGRSDLTLAVARSTTGQPGVSVAGAPLDAAPGRAASLGAGDVLQAWPAGGEGVLEAEVQAWTFDLPEPEVRSLSSWSASVAAGEAAAWTLPGGALEARVALEPGMAAAFLRGGRAQRVVWAADAPRAEVWSGAADALVVVNPTGSEARASVSLLPAGELAPLTDASPWESRQPSAGTLTLQVPPARGPVARTLHLGGAVEDAWLLGGDGQLRHGTTLDAAAGGTLVLTHGPGLSVAWLETEDPASRWGEAAAAAVPVDLPARVELTAAAYRLRLPASEEAVHVRTAAPVVAAVHRPGQPPVVSVHPDGASLDLPPHAGLEVELRPLGAPSLWGEALVTSTPVVDTSEGLGPEVLLAPGESRVFRFQVDRPGPVGVGVRATADTVTATVVGADGAVLGQGLTLMPEFTAGSWYVVLHNPSGAAVVRARPALVGVEAPDTGPPADVVRQYTASE